VQRLMTDNGNGYRSHAHAALCRQLGIRHLFTQPYRPKTNGKACVLGSSCRPVGR
jgi:transposase InsO family protein